MADATISIEDSGEFKIVHIGGQLDESNVDEKIKDIYTTVEGTPQNLMMILDLTNLEYMNSKSIGYLTDLYGKITESGGKIAIASAKPNIVDILQVVGLTQLIQKYDTIEAAKTAMGSGTPTAAPQPATTPETPIETPATEAPTPTPAEATPEVPTTPTTTPPAQTEQQPQEQLTTPAPTPETPTADPVATPEAPVGPSPAPETPAQPTPQAEPQEQPPAPGTGETFNL